MCKQETDRFYHYYKYDICCILSGPEPKVCVGIIKHLLNSTSSNVRLVLPGQGMLDSALLRPASLVTTLSNKCLVVL